MAKTMAATLLDAADKARIAGRRVTSAERALAKAIKARDHAEAVYMELVVKVVPTTPRPSTSTGQEVQQQTA